MAEAGVASCSIQAKTTGRECRSSRSPDAESPMVEAAGSVGTVGLPSQQRPMPPAIGVVVEAAVSVGTVGLPSQEWPMPPAIRIPEATSVPHDVPAAKRQRRTPAPIGSERPGVQSAWCGAAEQTSPGEVQQLLSFSSLRTANPATYDHLLTAPAPTGEEEDA